MKLNIFPKLIFPTLALLLLVNIKTSSAAESYFSDGTLLKGRGPEVFVLEKGLKRWIINPEIFDGLGYDWGKILWVTDSVLAQYPTGQELKKTSQFPDGTLVKASGPEVYLIRQEARYWVPDPITFDNLGLRWENIIQITDEKMKKIREKEALPPQGSPKRYPETWLVGDPPEFFTGQRITFDFSGRVPDQSQSSIKFETFLEGYDRDWRQTSRAQRTVTLEQEDTPYVFFVRAKDGDDNIDPTPARYSFYISTSPYFGKIRISSGKTKQSEPVKEYVVLNNQSRETIDITGWSLESIYEKSKYFIPQAKEIPNYQYFGRTQNIKLPRSGQVLIFSGRSPNLQSFRLNKCTGYLNNHFDFLPALPRQCPTSFKDNLYSPEITSACRKLIKQLSPCDEPVKSEIYHLGSCRDFILENINYQACVEKHKDEVDFLDKKWYVYLNQEKELWDNYSDQIILRDKNGLVVDVYKY